MNTSTSITIIGTAERFFQDKGFGFATAPIGPNGGMVDVFFHVRDRREVTGTADSPLLTDERDSNDHLYIGHRNRPKIVMQITQGTKGPKAAAWGVLPRRDWRVDLMNSGRLDTYIGGQVHIRNANRRNNQLTEGVLREYRLTSERLVLFVADGWQGEAHRRDSFHFRELWFGLKDCFGGPKSNLPYGRFGLELRGDEEVYITFYPPVRE